jgi:hypothetical protein
VVVTATRDGMNLVPYEYVVCRQGPAGSSAPGGSSNGGGGGSNMLPDKRHGMLVVSEFVGCSPSLSGAIRVNPWSIEAVRRGVGWRWVENGLPLAGRGWFVCSGSQQPIGLGHSSRLDACFISNPLGWPHF